MCRCPHILSWLNYIFSCDRSALLSLQKLLGEVTSVLGLPLGGYFLSSGLSSMATFGDDSVDARAYQHGYISCTIWENSFSSDWDALSDPRTNFKNLNQMSGKCLRKHFKQWELESQFLLEPQWTKEMEAFVLPRCCEPRHRHKETSARYDIFHS